jgi:hypothetical protein
MDLIFDSIYNGKATDATTATTATTTAKKATETKL